MSHGFRNCLADHIVYTVYAYCVVGHIFASSLWFQLVLDFLLPMHSGPDDYVFVNMVGHGGVGVFAFPDFSLVGSSATVCTLAISYVCEIYCR